MNGSNGDGKPLQEVAVSRVQSRIHAHLFDSFFLV